MPNKNIELEQEFLETVCCNANCGSQRCDGSSEWLQGCKLFKKFLEEKEISK